jgi:hypothetical protein
MTTTFQAQSDGISYIPKAPTAVLDYIENWTDWLAQFETIVAVVVIISDPTMTISPAPTWAGGFVTVWLNGGALGTTYLVTVHITTSAGRQDDRSFRVRCTTR